MNKSGVVEVGSSTRRRAGPNRGVAMTSISRINRRASLAVAAVPLLAGLAVLGAPAQAGAATVKAETAAARAASTAGSCSSKGGFINFSAFYHNSGRYHVFTSYAW